MPSEQAASERRGEPELERPAPSHLGVLNECAGWVSNPSATLLTTSISRTQARCLQRQRPSPSKLRLGDFGPGFAEHLKTSKTALIERSHIGRIAVIKLLKNIMHH